MTLVRQIGLCQLRESSVVNLCRIVFAYVGCIHRLYSAIFDKMHSLDADIVQTENLRCAKFYQNQSSLLEDMIKAV